MSLVSKGAQLLVLLMGSVSMDGEYLSLGACFNHAKIKVTAASYTCIVTKGGKTHCALIQ